MMFATHQPIFLPWLGLFCKLAHAGTLVLLDDVQFPRGKSWMARNRIKSDAGELWLTVPVQRKGRGLQAIRNVEICDETNWRATHLRSIREKYAHAPYLQEFLPGIEEIYGRKHRLLVDLNVDLVRFLQNAMNVKGHILLQSEINVPGVGTELLIKLAAKLRADEYVTFAPVEKYLDVDMFTRNAVRLQLLRFTAPVYPQLWGPHICNLSALDMLLDCGPKCLEILQRSCRLAEP